MKTVCIWLKGSEKMSVFFVGVPSHLGPVIALLVLITRDRWRRDLDWLFLASQGFVPRHRSLLLLYLYGS